MPNIVLMLEPNKEKPVAVDASDEQKLVQLMHDGWVQAPLPAVEVPKREAQ